jgi:tRNA-splicing endonuclease subunit Sen34
MKDESADAAMSAHPTPATPTKGTKEQSYSFTIPAESDFTWYKPEKYHTIDEARNAGIWSYPTTLEEAARCHVFEDLWKQGYYMGNGLRFGGHWLVYPGEFLR